MIGVIVICLRNHQHRDLVFGYLINLCFWMPLRLFCALLAVYLLVKV